MQKVPELEDKIEGDRFRCALEGSEEGKRRCVCV
eukprot:COSAG02_NODE_649_length_18914_cov_30.645868_11_plen_34_part_00